MEFGVVVWAEYIKENILRKLNWGVGGSFGKQIAVGIVSVVSLRFHCAPAVLQFHGAGTAHHGAVGDAAQRVVTVSHDGFANGSAAAEIVFIGFERQGVSVVEGLNGLGGIARLCYGIAHGWPFLQPLRGLP